MKKAKAILVLIIGFTFCVVSAGAAPVSPIDMDPTHEANSFQQVKYLSWPAYEGAGGPPLSIIEGTSQVFRFDRSVSRAAVSDAAVCDITPVNKQEILIYAKKAGRINFIVWDESNQIATYDVHSVVDVDGLDQILKKVDPKSTLEIVPFHDTVVVTGVAETSAKAKAITDAVNVFNGKARTFVEVRDPKQVFLEVRFAEVNRKASQDFGFDGQLVAGYWSLESLFGRNSPAVTGNQLPTRDQTAANAFFSRDAGTSHPTGIPFLGVPQSDDNSDLFVSYSSGNAWVETFLQWLIQKNILKIIARPNLLAKDGEEAKFVVGGEFPVPVTDNNSVNIEYKEFGTKLKFTPEVLNKEVIRLKVLTEISELDFSTTVTSGGTTVPSTLKRSYETVAELRDGETLVIGGVITQRINKVTKRFPILGSLPFLDRFFKREDFDRTDVEILVVITPHIVSPFKMDQPKTYFDQERIESVKEGVKPYLPAFPDLQGDAINQILTQGESYANFAGDENVIKKVAQEVVTDVKLMGGQAHKQLPDVKDPSEQDEGLPREEVKPQTNETPQEVVPEIGSGTDEPEQETVLAENNEPSI